MALEQEEADGVYEQFVLVAEDTWKLYRDTYKTNHSRFGEAPIACEQISTVKFDMNFGGFEWKCIFVGRENTLAVSCNNRDQQNTKFELSICDEKFKLLKVYGAWSSVTVPMRFSISWSNSVARAEGRCLNLTIRVLKRRSVLPDLTSEHVKFGNLKSNHTLKVGGQTFHVNKELLSQYSHFFDRMFNGGFEEAKKAEDLATERAEPRLFNDFLLFMACPGGFRVLPNRSNVVGLMHLARFYQVDLLVENCTRFLENCHEMSAWERIMAAKKLGLKELETRIVSELNTMEAWKEVALKFMENVHVDVE